MAIKEKINKNASDYRDKKKNEVVALLLFAASIFIFISLLTFDYNDLPFFTSSVNKPVKNFAGMVGAYMGCGLLVIMGFSAFVIPVLSVLWAISRLAGNKPENYYLKLFGTAFLIVALSSTLSLLTRHDQHLSFRMGGIAGTSFSVFLVNYLGIIGAAVSIIVLLLLSLLVATDFFIFPFIMAFTRGIAARISGARGEPAAPKIKTLKEKDEIKPPAREIKPRQPENKGPVINIIKPRGQDKTLLEKIKKDVIDTVKPKDTIKAEVKPAEKPKVAAVDAEGAAKTDDLKEGAKPGKEKENVMPKPRGEKKPYTLPSIDILRSPPPFEERELKEDLTETSKILEDILKDFGIEAKVIEVNRGPVITRYELEPGKGVQVHKITSLADNIALTMKAQSIRIVAPVPGKGTVGVEVPNSKSVMVFLKEILESDEFKGETSKLTLAFGKDIAGNSVIADLADMPHLLIAGSTGSGKTVCMNSVIAGILFNATPEDVRFIMVDPKKVELAPYNNLPHLLCPVLTDYKKVPVALDWLVSEMERRYELFASVGVRNISFYNKKAATEGWEPLYYIVVVIDELADLMMVSAQEIENAITRLAQLSRAVGIHLILATQRPSVDVITGVIKANFPSRISFKVASKVDSRTVLDLNGAEKLLGKGDMLFVQPGSDKPVRAQGSLVSDDEIEKITDFIKKQRGPDYIEDIVKPPKKAAGGSKFQKDEIYEEAVRLVMETGQASVSMIQRKLGVGYQKAGRLIDMMEEDGIVGPYQGSKPRDILVETEAVKQEEENENG